jgi:methylaspartate ammonia-lyase
VKVARILVAEISGGYFYDDQAAMKAGAVLDGEWIAGDPLTPGFDAIRMPATGIGIGLELEGGSIAWGDAISVQYPGVAGRNPPLDVREVTGAVRDRLGAAMVGLDTTSFRDADAAVTALLGELSIGHVAVAYGVSQALLGAAALSQRCTMAEVICREFGVPLNPEPVPVFAQCGDRPRANVDKMILKGVDALPHGLINNPEKFGPGGETFLEYVGWVSARVGQLSRSREYEPTLHFDLYGCAGDVFGDDTEALCSYLARCADAAAPYRLRIETPVIAGSRAEQVARLREIIEVLERREIPVEILADEWCNTLEDIREFVAQRACHGVQIKMPDLGSVANVIEAVLECRRSGVMAYLGGSCAETELSARVAVHIAVATQADVQLAKPGMGVDEGLMIVRNEQARLLAQLPGSGHTAGGTRLSDIQNHRREHAGT